MTTEPEGTDEELHALVTDAIKVGDVARRYARLYGGEANTVHAAVEATLDVLLQRKAVEGSTPIASPAAVSRGERGTRCAAPSRWYLAGRWNPGPCFLAAGHPGEHMGAPPGQSWTPDPAGEVVSVPPPGEADVYLCSTCMAVITFTTGEAPRCPNCPPPAAEPVPVPPPVDALLKLVDEFGREAHAYGLGDDSFGDTMTDSWKEINSRVRALWAAGVEEGRREDERALMQALMERDDYEEIADKLTSAVGRHLGVDMGEHSNANSPWENALNALDEADGGKFVKGAYEDGVAEGRRQATEERTEEVERLQALLDHAEQYARDLQDGGYVPLAMDEADYAEETAERADG